MRNRQFPHFFGRTPSENRKRGCKESSFRGELFFLQKVFGGEKEVSLVAVKAGKLLE